MPDDLITMQGPNGPHVGFMIEANGRLLVMHANGHQGELGPEGIVELHELRQAVSNGYARFRFWRATCS
jgi:hypothetical protein